MSSDLLAVNSGQSYISEVLVIPKLSKCWEHWSHNCLKKQIPYHQTYWIVVQVDGGKLDMARHLDD